MKPVLALLSLMLASPAWAHDGVHLHPHGAESWLPVILGSLLIAGAAVLARVKR